MTRTVNKPRVLVQGQAPPPPEQETLLGIYSFEGEQLRICFAEPGKKRPAEFRSDADVKSSVMQFQRDPTKSASAKYREQATLNELQRAGADAFRAGNGRFGGQIYVTCEGEKGTDELLAQLAPHLKKLTVITGLHLHKSKITDAGLAALKDLNNISHINMEKTQITDAGLEHLRHMTKLDLVILTGTKVTDAGVKSLREALPQLRVEKLSQAQERSEDELHKAGAVFGSLPGGGLVEIRFQGVGRDSKLNDADLKLLKEHLDIWKASLRTIDFSDSDITDAGLTYLKGLTNLKTLVLSNTKVTDTGAKAIKEAIPGLEVKR